MEGKTGICGILVGAGKTKLSSKVTHCWVGFPPGGGSLHRGAAPNGVDEGCATGKGGADDRSAVRGSRSAGVGLRVDDGPNRDVVLWSWEVGAAAGGADIAGGAGVGMSG